MDFAEARRNMVESQLRTNRISEESIILAMGKVPRERFVPEKYTSMAYIDEDLPIGRDRYLIEPMVLGRMLQAVAPQSDDAALVIGCGTGYAAAVLADLCGAVLALESDKSFLADASTLLSTLGADNAVVVEGPLDKGWAEQAPYNVILFDGAVADVPSEICDQLAEDGRLAAVIQSDDGIGRATLMEKRGNVVSGRPLFDATIPALPGLSKSAGFVF